jgi:uncharacterized protein YecE (DUF72 family)
VTPVYLGTSAFTANGWSGAFYPKGTKSANYITYYATRFDTVEVDSTFYACPTVSTVEGWARKTPADFIFSVKVPRSITHEKVLVDCDVNFKQFIETMSFFGDKLGPVVFQFPFFNQTVFTSDVQFVSRLKAFFKQLPTGYKFAVEIRNKHWLKPKLIDLLREYNVALVLQDQNWMPGPDKLFDKFDPLTADFTYIRLLGDRKRIEKITTVWNETIVDRTAELTTWVDVCQKIQKRGVTIYVYANNHYSGFAPATVELFRKIGAEKGLQIPRREVQITMKLAVGSLFDER